MTFLNLKESDIADWRDLAVSKSFLGWWRDWINVGRETVVALAARGKHVEATAAAGKVQALEELLSAITEVRSSAPLTAEELFTDPAERPRRQHEQSQ